MRSRVYGLAVLASFGIMIAIATLPPPANPNIMREPGTLVMSVPEMNCEFSCFPKVKETLEQTTAVKVVELAAQKEEGTIDNRQVIVKYNAGFNIQKAIVLLEQKGFAKSSLAQSTVASSPITQ